MRGRQPVTAACGKRLRHAENRLHNMIIMCLEAEKCELFELGFFFRMMAHGEGEEVHRLRRIVARAA